MAGAGPRFGPSVSATHGINHKVSQGSISEECLAGALSVPLLDVLRVKDPVALTTRGLRRGRAVADALNRLKVSSVTRSPRVSAREPLHYVRVPYYIDRSKSVQESIGSRSSRFSFRCAAGHSA